MANRNPIFSARPPETLYLDINSCFASIEQQDNPQLRDKPIAVAPYRSPRATIVAASVEAKKYNINTGCHIREAKKRYPEIIIVKPRHQRYQAVHQRMFRLLKSYTPSVVPVSIDEFCLDFSCFRQRPDLTRIAQKIKQNIAKNIGRHVTVSVGIAPNRLLAKTACELEKPDGLNTIHRQNFPFIYQQLPVDELWGIGPKTRQKLQDQNIVTVLDLYQAPLEKLQTCFNKPQSYRLYRRLRGYQVRQNQTDRKSFGNSRHLPYPITKPEEMLAVLQNLICRTCFRLQKNHFKSRKITAKITSTNRSFRQTHSLSPASHDPRFICKYLFGKIKDRLPRQAEKIACRCHSLIPAEFNQLAIWSTKKAASRQAMQAVNIKYSPTTLTLGRIPPGPLQK